RRGGVVSRPCPRAGTFASRAERLEHARSCLACRAELVASDPSALFALLAARPVPRSVLDAVSAGVPRSVREGAVRRSVLSRRAVAWAAALLVAVGCGTLWLATSRAPEGSGYAQALPEPAPRAAGVELLASPSPGTAQVVDVSVGDT